MKPRKWAKIKNIQRGLTKSMVWEEDKARYGIRVSTDT